MNPQAAPPQAHQPDHDPVDPADQQDMAGALDAAPDMQSLYALLDKAGIEPGWNKTTPSLWPHPRKTFLPAHWTYKIGRAALAAAGRHVSTELAERRNLILYNPAPGNTYATSRTIIAAYQMVKGGETARSHRHTPNALRLVVETGSDAYTVVNGKRLPMLPGDVLLTPNGAWHGHANLGAQDAVWIDFLDVPVVHFLEPMFFEHHPDGVESADAVDAQSPWRFPIADSMRQLDESSAVAHSGGMVRRILLGPPHLHTMRLEIFRFEPGTAWSPARSTASSVFAVIDGEGDTTIDDTSFHWTRGDVFVAPAWRPVHHRASQRSHLLRVSDEALLEKLDWLKFEQPGTADKAVF